ncbi:hypothetical protein HQN59_24340 [Schlegelella sp. ID0723]|uniref:Uncharacterized protein n=1 Tax=Piscinibacter koreensis TaxID=2742824 RepID=A0A7Y6NTB3_9BURK|nr:hypothetical protein [Schlegelella koreensis]
MTQMVVAAAGKDWGALKEQGRKDAQAGIKAKLNKEVASRMTAAQLTESDPNGCVRGFLRRIGAALTA